MKAVHAGLAANNQQFAAWEGAGPLSILLRDKHGALAGGLLGFIYWG